ncbi:MAG: hypothetical protein CMJ35_03110 [Phycisphaerae bacterium]|nr:hypothetical protein [Phycisphaerae bacterium]MBM90589.1 hypothetical protein [Phycisphaerae bacterium]HCT43579.1 hypothetical protein [Phycisphaerales bacterium]
MFDSGSVMMVWAPVFAIITLLSFRRYSISKLMTNECRLVADLSSGDERDTTLAEPRVLKAPGTTGGVRLQILIIIILMFCCPAIVLLWFWHPELSDLFSPIWGGVIGLFLGIALELLTLSGWVRFGLGSVLLDESKLIVPNLLRKKTFYPDRVRIWCSETSPDAYTLVVMDNRGTRSLLYVDRQAMCDVRAWIRTS